MKFICLLFVFVSTVVSAETIKPIDEQNWGYLRILFPVGLAGQVGLGPQPQQITQSFSQSTQPLRLDPNSPHYLQISGFFKGVSIQPQKTTDFNLSGLSLINSWPERYVTDLGPRALLYREYELQKLPQPLRADRLTSDLTPQLALPGKYTYHWQPLVAKVLDPIPVVDVHPGKVDAKISLDQSDKRTTVVIHHPQPTLKNSSCFGDYTSEQSPILIWRVSEPPLRTVRPGSPLRLRKWNSRPSENRRTAVLPISLFLKKASSSIFSRKTIHRMNLS